MATRFVNIDRETPMLLPPDMKDWVAKDDLVRFIIDAVETCDLRLAKVNPRGTGDAQYPPAMMLSLLIYCYGQGLFSSRVIERATYSQVSVRYLCGNEHPDHDTIATFRRENMSLLESCFVAVLQLARELKAFERLGTISVDGTKLKARASRGSNRRLPELEQEIAALQSQIAELLAQAEAADQKEGAAPRQALAEELQDKEQRQAALRAAKAQLQARQEVARRRRQEQARGEDPEEPSAPSCRVRGATDPEKAAEKTARQVEETPAKKDAQRAINLVEPESRLMRDAHGAYLQGYNAQLVVEAGTESRSQLILGVHLSQDGNDRRVLEEALVQVPKALRQEVTHVLADTGYDNTDLICAVEKKWGLQVLCPPQSQSAPPPNTNYRLSKVQQRRRQSAQAMRERLAQPENKLLYRRRAASSEPVFGVLKNVLGFRRFRLFGLAKAKIELLLVATAYNLRHLAQQAALNPS
jgi:transposase